MARTGRTQGLKKYWVLDYQDRWLPAEVKADIRKYGLSVEWGEGIHYYEVEGVEASADYPHLDNYILKTLGINELILIEYWW